MAKHTTNDHDEYYAGVARFCADLEEELPGGSTPSQYALPASAVELQDLIEHREMNFAVGNIFKAAYRLGRKDGISAEYDLRKIIWFAERELNRVANEKC